MELWHTRSCEEVMGALNTSREGLSQTEAERRIAEFGENRLNEAKRHGILYKFFLQFKNVMVIVLLAAALVTAVVAIVEKSSQEFIDVGIILAIVLLNAVIGVVQENKAEQSLDALKNLSKPYAKVRRDGEVARIESSRICEGDLVILEAGDIVPADLRLTMCASLKVEEAALTGESLAVEKSTQPIEDEKASLGDRHNMAYSGSVVTYGRGEGVAVATGMRAETGKIAAMLESEDASETPIQKKLDKTGKFISIAVLIIAAIIFLVGVLSTISIGVTVDKILRSFMTAVAIAVAAIPEGLTAVITIIMAIGVQAMSRRNAIIRKLPAVETLGSTEIICSDKTGTLTLNQMTVMRTYTANQTLNGEAGEGEEFRQLLRCMVLCNDTLVGKDFRLTGDPTETALVAFAKRQGVDKVELSDQYPRIDEIPFDSDRKLMTTIHSIEGKTVAYTKGAPDILLARCANILDGDKVRPLTQADRQAVEAANKRMASDALRVLAYAAELDDATREEGMTFLGLTGMIDPPREEVKQAVKVCKQAGMRAVMITGDHRDTAFAIAKELGIAKSEDEVITGKELSELSDDALYENVEKYRVYARVSPEHKVRIVKAWKKRGKIVAMTGDGVNDAPSIKAADIGIGMGITGTDVTKGAADMVLADDNFATIVVAVEEGRKIFANIQKTIQFLLSANVAEVLALFIATMLFARQDYVFLLPIQILWVNLITDSLPALALGMEPAEGDIMRHPPRKSSDNLFAGRIGINIVYQGLLQAAIVLGVFVFCVYYQPWGHEVGTTMAFLVLCFVQLFHCFNTKSLDRSVFHKSLFENKFMWLSFGIGVLLTLAVALIPFMHNIFRLRYLDWQQWLVVLGASFLIVPVVECVKLVTNILKKRRESRA